MFSPIEYIAGLGQIPLQEMAYKASKGIMEIIDSIMC